MGSIYLGDNKDFKVGDIVEITPIQVQESLSRAQNLHTNKNRDSSIDIKVRS